ncbi:Fungal-trans domain-containing protein [Mycena venus]|uniref:Fungal-trans domain-containing protein n=1 Tax=Mycena venus TaxID=2733690 RepID=A0A8H6XAB4_9AGAR|nr:Fungal-trans domain-containing protein [Mycena venus]
MSSDELVGASSEPSAQNHTRMKRRRQLRSCDTCRHRKTRCDGPTVAGGICSNCAAFGSTCTYAVPYRKRGPKHSNDIAVEELQRENASLRSKLRLLSICSLCAQSLQSQPQEDGFAEIASLDDHSTGTPSSDAIEPPDEKDLTTDELATRFSQFSLESIKTSYFGSGSTFALANNASMMKEKYLGSSSSTHPRRPYFWQVLPWETETFFSHPGYIFPAADLISSLLFLYFANVHPTFPLLHRPSFERSVAEGLHFRDVEFGGTLLSVLAVASRYSNDPRVFVDGGASLSAGWKFAAQIRILRKCFEPTIHEVQMYGLLSLFMLGTSAPQVSWLYTGLGIRCIQQRGEHRKKPEGHKRRPEDELWRRAFWSLVSLERYISHFLGRPMGLDIEECDVELPLEVDDEYWDQGFVQPLGKPSQLSYFCCYVRLFEILGDAMRRLYSSKKAKMSMGWDGPEWEQRAVAELDSKMNHFLDSIPPHLQWDPENPPQGMFFDQAASLNMNYNYILIAIHRRYIQKSSVQATPSLSICASAARVILHTADVWLSKLQRVPLNNFTSPVFMSGVVLVLYMLGAKRAGHPMDKDRVRVATALEILKFSESRLQPAGRLWELLRELWSLDGPLPSTDPPSNESGSLDASGHTTPIPASSGANVPDQYHSQLGQSFSNPWNSILTSDQSSESAQGMSIEQLLASDRDPFSIESIESMLDDDLMSLWMVAPGDVNIEHWDAYRNDNGADAVNWSSGFGEQCSQYSQETPEHPN